MHYSTSITVRLPQCSTVWSGEPTTVLAVFVHLMDIDCHIWASFTKMGDLCKVCPDCLECSTVHGSLHVLKLNFLRIFFFLASNPLSLIETSPFFIYLLSPRICFVYFQTSRRVPETFSQR